MVLSGSLFDST